MLVPAQPDQTIVLFPLLIGVLAILFAVFNTRLLPFMRLRPMSETLTIPRLQRSAQINEQLGRMFLLLIGISFLIQAFGPLFMSADLTFMLAVAALVLAGLVALMMVGIALANWKTK